MPGWGLTVLLPQAVGVRRAREMSVTGNFIDAEQACELGLVNHVVPHDELLPYCRQLAADCRTVDQLAVRRMLATYDENSLTTTAEAWLIEDRVLAYLGGLGFRPRRDREASRRHHGARSHPDRRRVGLRRPLVGETALDSTALGEA